MGGSLLKRLKDCWPGVLLCALFFLGPSLSAQEDTIVTGSVMGRMDLPDPTSIENMYSYDPITDRYILSRMLGDFDISYPVILTPEEYEERVRSEQIKSYFQEKIDAADGRKEGAEEAQRNLLPTFYVNSNFFESVFGGNTIEIIPQGSVEMDLGLLYTKQDNPQFSPRNRSNLSFDFDQRISLSLLGKIGERLQITANYDTQSTFDFQNSIKLEYTPTEDDIIRKIEVGNVSMPLNSSLIQGAQSLFGVKTQLQFGRTTITGIFSEQRSETRSVVAEGGATVTEFELFALDYDENRHFFLSHYFRDNYDRVLKNYPFINSAVQITRAEVWITNRNNTTNDVRNIIALQDIGESKSENIGLNNVPGGFINAPINAFPDNDNNDFNPFGIDNPSIQSILSPAIRDVATASGGFGGVNVNDGIDYVSLENARKLQPNEYNLNRQLGYISLNQRLNNDEVLAVAYQFTVNGKVYQVGEFSTDGVQATGQIPGQNQGEDPGGDPGSGGPGSGDPGNVQAIPQNLVVKLLKSNITNVQEPVWDLMMKNIYPIGAYQLEQEDFRMNILYLDPSPLNYISPVSGTAFPEPDLSDVNAVDLNDATLLRVFNLDRLNYNNDPQQGGDGFFDFYPGLTVDQQNGAIIFTSVEPFGDYLFDKLATEASEYYDLPETYNANQSKYVFRSMYRTTKIQAEQQESQKNKFQLKGTYKSTGSDGIPIGAFNIPQGSVTVTAGGRTLVEGVDYTVNYQLGRVQILDPSLQNSNTPVNISVENNSMFGQQTKRLSGIDIQHKFSDDFQIGGTLLNLNERPLTQKAAFQNEPINNTMFGVNMNYSTEVPFLTRMVNKLPNIDTDVPSQVSVRGEFAYLLPGAPKVSDFGGKATAYIDDFEAAQTAIDISAPLTWFLSSTPLGLGGDLDNNNLAANYNRAKLNWYTIDPIFYSAQRPSGIGEQDLSSPFTRRLFRNEIFPDQDIVQGQTQALFSLDLNYKPTERGPYNFNPAATDNVLTNPETRFAGISRQLSTTDFERSNVEYIQFWLMDPFIYEEYAGNQGGELVFNLGNISEDVLKDGRKQYENGLPEDGSDFNTIQTNWGRVPSNQSLVYTFSSTGPDRENQDVGLDGLSDVDEAAFFPNFAGQTDPARDNYTYFLQTEGSLLERYDFYNGTQGNSPETLSNTNRGSTAQPDVEDINRDNTMNTVDSYFEYAIDIRPGMSLESPYVTDIKEITVPTPANQDLPVRWIQFRIPLSEYTDAVNGISDFRSIRFMRMYLTGFEQETVLRFGTMELYRGDYRRYTESLDSDNSPNELDNTTFENEAVGVIQNSNYVIPPGVYREELNNNNNIIRQDEQSLALRVCDLEPEDGRAVYKNFNVDMRQYKNLEMFIHAESLPTPATLLADGDLAAFIRLGNDLNTSFYEIEMPLNVSPYLEQPTDADASIVWPEENRLNMPLALLQAIKTKVLDEGTADPTQVVYYSQEELDPGFIGSSNPLRIGIKGNPSFGNVRVIMVGLRNKNNANVCGEVWFNELRMSELENKGGWAAVANMDANIADFADISATGRTSTIGFGSIEQGPNQRSLEDLQQYDIVTNVNLGQLLPKKWGIQLPFNYGIQEELITPKYDPEFDDIILQERLDNAPDAATRDAIEEQSINYTKRQSINFIGVRKNRNQESEATPMPYDIENFTFSYSYNEEEHHDFEIESAMDQSVRLGGTYDYSFNNKPIEPFKKNDSLFMGKYWQFLKDFNFNPLPSNVSVSSNIIRNFNQQKFRELNLLPGQIGLPTLYQRNFMFDWQYTVNYNLTNSLRFNFNAANNRIVNNYIDNGLVDNSIQIWDGFFEIGDPNQHVQSLQVNYDLPTAKFPFLKWIRATYSYQGDYQWQDGSDLFSNVEVPSENGPSVFYDLGNSVQNASTHRINSNLDLTSLYRYLGIKKLTGSSDEGDGRSGEGSNSLLGGAAGKGQERESMNKRDQIMALRNGSNSNARPAKKLSPGQKVINSLIGLATSVKKAQINYLENNGIFLPGYLPSVGFGGSLRPSTGFVFGSQAEVRDLAARKGWLTIFPEFNQQYTEVESRQLDMQVNTELLDDLKIDFNASRLYSENFSENYIVEDGLYRSLTPNTFGNFNISTVLINTAFGNSDEFGSAAFDAFKSNRLTIAQRLAERFYGSTTYPVDEEGYPEGFGKNSQQVLLPAFVAAYRGSDASKERSGIFRDVPLPNWDLKYTGFMKMKWFKKRFKRFSIQHGYRAAYTLNQFQTNLDYNRFDPTELDQSGNFKSEIILNNVNLTEQFSPLIKVDFEMMNSVKILAEIRKDRALSLSFANNLMTEIQGEELILGLGYRIKDLRIGTNFGGKRSVMKSDLNFKLDFSVRDNKTIIRYLDVDNNQTTAGQTIYGLQFSSDYALTKNLTALFFYDHTFSEYAISTAFPQTTIRSGFTLRYNFGN